MIPILYLDKISIILHLLRPYPQISLLEGLSVQNNIYAGREEHPVTWVEDAVKC